MHGHEESPQTVWLLLQVYTNNTLAQKIVLNQTAEHMVLVGIELILVLVIISPSDTLNVVTVSRQREGGM